MPGSSASTKKSADGLHEVADAIRDVARAFEAVSKAVREGNQAQTRSMERLTALMASRESVVDTPVEGLSTGEG